MKRYETRRKGEELYIKFYTQPSGPLWTILREFGYTKIAGKIGEWVGTESKDYILQRLKLWETTKRGETAQKRTGTLCWDCANYCGGCSWSRNFTPVEGWSANLHRSDRYNHGKLIGVTESYEVISCPEFVSDSRCAV